MITHSPKNNVKLYCNKCEEWIMDTNYCVRCSNCGISVHWKCVTGCTLPWLCEECAEFAGKKSNNAEALGQKKVPAQNPLGSGSQQSNAINQTRVIAPSPLAQSTLQAIAPAPLSRKSSKKSVASNKSRVTMSEYNDMQKKKLDNLQRQRQLLQLEAEILKQENEVIEQQLDNMTIISSEDDDRQDDFVENQGDPPENIILDRFMNEQQRNAEVKPERKGNAERQASFKVEIPPRDPQQSTQHQNSFIQNEATVNLNRWTARHALRQELPVFTGRPEEWPAFIAAYENSTSACGFTDQENLVRLQKAVKSPAREQVESLMFSPKCVSRIITTLRRMFAQPTQLFNSYLEKFKKEPAPREERPESILTYIASVQNLWAVIQSTNLESHMSNPFIMETLIEKLPQSYRFQWDAFVQGKSNDMTSLVEWLDELADRICRVNPNMDLVSYSKGVKSRNHHLHYQDSEAPSSTIQSHCLACDKRCRYLSECPKFLNMSQENRWKFILSKGVCKQCLKKHHLRPPYNCPSRIKCEEEGCNGKHHKLIHRFRIEPTPDVPLNEPESSPGKKDELQLNHHSSDEKLLFRFIPVIVRFGDKSVKTAAFLDEGSSGTFMNEDLALQLEASGPVSPLCIQYTSNNQHVETDSMKIDVHVKGNYVKAQELVLKGVQTVKNLNLPSQTLDFPHLKNKYTHLENLSVESYDDLKPQILIGLNNWSLGIPLDVKMGRIGEPIAARCRLGWTIFASQNEFATQNIHFCNFTDQKKNEDEKLDEMMRKYYSLEDLGIRLSTNEASSREDKRALRIMNDSIRRVSDRYEIALLWQHDDVELPDSHGMALKRLHCLEARLRRDKELGKLVSAQVKNLVDKGYARKVGKDELARDLPRKWYLPIFPVVNVNKPGKVRLVFDAAAKTNDVSLNSTLLKGPDQNSTLIGVLMRFRQRRFAISGDIKEMFMQVRIRAPDCYSQLFLFRDDEKAEPDTYILNSMTFGATCSPACAQFVKNYNATKFEATFPRAVEAIIHNHYVDDLLDSVDTEEEALQLINDVKFVHSQAGFEIRGWKSNSRQVMKTFGTSEEQLNLQIDAEDEAEKVLGMWWARNSDEFTYSLKFNKGNRKVLLGAEKPTKREMLRIMMSLYDPLGLLTHFTSILKVLMQDVWRSAIGWDDQIDDKTFGKWLQWLKMLWQVENLSISRCYLKSFSNWENLHVQLHIFTDASEDCCAAAAYLRVESPDAVEVSLVMGKSKVAPLKMSSVPRLELVAALIGARMSATIMKELTIKIHRTVFWTDSTTVLSWIRSDTKKMRGYQYERFRTAEIQDITIIANWRYIPSKENVADDATKVNKLELTSDDRWFRGPPFLPLDENEWPSDVVTKDIQEELVTEAVHTIQTSTEKSVIHFECHSSWIRLVKIVATVMKYIRQLKNICAVKKGTNPTNISHLENMQTAETFLLQKIQRNKYQEEMSTLNEYPSSTVRKCSKLSKLTPIIENGLLKVGSRITNVLGESPYANGDFDLPIPETVTRPVILPRNHPGTELLVRSYHEKYLHVNHETVVNEVRQRYFISGLRQLLKKIRRSCPRCALLDARVIQPKMADLPLARLAVGTLPFTYTGIDCMGPFNVVVRRRPEKRWILLLTCLTVRAIHLEVLHGMDYDSFILAFRSFTARRGQPREVFSDNGTNFVKAERVLRDAMKDLDYDRIEKSMNEIGIKWHFNPPDASHMGGSWERLVKSVKIALYNAMPNRSISDPLFKSLTTEIENMVNSRPLVYIPLDHENQESLTPNHFLLQSSSGMKPIGHFDDNAKLLKSNWLNSQLYAKKFWDKWIAEYLPELLCRSKWHNPVKPLEEGDLVLIVDESKPKFEWQRGRIESLKKSRDGQVRSVTVKTATGYLIRPASKLARILLEKSGAAGVSPPGGSVGKNMTLE